MNVIKNIRIRYKIHKLISKMADQLPEERLYCCARRLGKVYKLIPQHKREQYLDSLIEVLENAGKVL